MHIVVAAVLVQVAGHVEYPVWCKGSCHAEKVPTPCLHIFCVSVVFVRLPALQVCTSRDRLALVQQTLGSVAESLFNGTPQSTYRLSRFHFGHRVGQLIVL